MMSRHAFHADDHKDNRLDQAIARGVPGLSRRRARALIAQGSVFIDGARVKVASRPLKRGAKIEVIDDEGIAKAPVIPVIFDEGGIVVVDKPAGLASEPTRQAATSVSDSFQSAGRPLTAVHRLDVDTTGVLVLAETPQAVAAWSKVFHDQVVARGYVALVAGVVGATGVVRVVDAPLLPPHKTGLARVSELGKAAQTSLRVLAHSETQSLLAVTPQTGRTHQIRAHLAHIGHPLVGDRRYNLAKAPAATGEAPTRKPSDPRTEPHLGLHAHSLAATVDDRAFSFTAPLPGALLQMIMNAGIDIAAVDLGAAPTAPTAPTAAVAKSEE